MYTGTMKANKKPSTNGSLEMVLATYVHHSTKALPL